MKHALAGALLFGGYVDGGWGGCAQHAPSNAPMRPFYGQGWER